MEVLNWIKVVDQFPPEHEKVLALLAGGTSDEEIATMYWSKQNGWYNFQFDLNRTIVKITYWAKLPKVPQNWYE